MRAKIFSFIGAAFALAGAMVSCSKTIELDPAVKLISESTINAPEEMSEQTVVFTSTTAWQLKGIEDYDWIDADRESGKGSETEQTIVLKISPTNEERTATLTIFASPLAKKTITINQVGQAMTVADFLALKDDADHTLCGKIGNISNSKSYYGFVLKDETGEISCPFPKNWDAYKDKLHTGDVVRITGKYEFYTDKSQDQLKDGIIKGQTPADMSNIETKSVEWILESKDAFNLYRYRGTVGADLNTNYCSFTLTDESSKSIMVYTVNNAADYKNKIKPNGTVTLVGAYTLYVNSKTGESKPELVDCTIESFEAGAVVENSVTGVVVATCKVGFLVKSDSGISYIYGKDNEPTVKVGDNVTVTGTETMYGDVPEIIDYKVTVNSTGNAVTHPAATEITAANISAEHTLFQYVKISGNLSISGTYYNLSVEGSDNLMGSLVNPNNVASDLNKCNVEVTGYYVGVTNNKYFNVMVTGIEKSANQPTVETPGEGSIVLTFPDDNKAKNGIGAYTETWTAKTGSTEFTIANFNNNKWDKNWTYIKCGRKSEPSVASIATAAVQTTAFDRVVLDIDSYSKDKVKSAKLYVASDNAFTNDLQTIDMVYENYTGKFIIPTPAANRYYKVVFDCVKDGSKNGFVQISKVTLWVNAK